MVPQMTDALFEILAPAQWHVPAVFSSPHSGQFMPPELLAKSRLGERELRLSEDCFVDELFGGCVANGMPLLRALASRAYLDLNREPYELDPRMFVESLPGYMNPGTPRVAAGFGTVPRFVGDGLEIYRGRLPLADALARIELLYKPYHRALNGLLAEAERSTGFALLVDCHSMPSTATSHFTSPAHRADIVLGDRHGCACGHEITDAIEAFFERQGLHVVRNRPYAGGFITETHGAPQHHRHAIQIEVNRALYMDERLLVKAQGFAAVQAALTQFSQHLNEIIEEFMPPRRFDLAAE